VISILARRYRNRGSVSGNTKILVFVQQDIPLRWVSKQMKKMTARYKLYLDNMFIVVDATCFNLPKSHH